MARTEESRKGKAVSFRFQCNACRKQFNAFTGTPFSRSKVPIRVWFKAYWYMRRQVKPEVYAKKIGISLRDGRELEKRIRRLDETYFKGMGTNRYNGHFLWDVRRFVRRYPHKLFPRSDSVKKTVLDEDQLKKAVEVARKRSDEDQRTLKYYEDKTKRIL